MSRSIVPTPQHAPCIIPNIKINTPNPKLPHKALNPKQHVRSNQIRQLLRARIPELQPTATKSPLQAVLRDTRIESVRHSTSQDGVLGIDDVHQDILEGDRVQHHLPHDQREISPRGVSPHSIVVRQRCRQRREIAPAMAGQGILLPQGMHNGLTDEEQGARRIRWLRPTGWRTLVCW